MAFNSCTELTSLSLPATLTTIGDAAFSSCTNLETVSFETGSQLSSIGAHAFDATGLTSLTLPQTLETIGESAFNGCRNLETVSFPEGSQLSSIGAHAFDATGLTSLTLPQSLETIGDFAFIRCSNLETVSFPEGSQLSSIGEKAFDACTKLTSLTLPALLETIGDYAFQKCSNLETVSFAEGSQLSSIGEKAFNSCTELTSLTLPATLTTIGEFAFINCSSLETVSFPVGSQLSSIGAEAFRSCTELKSLTLPKSLETINTGALANCTGLKTVIFEDDSSLTTIGTSAFLGSSALTTVEFGANSQLTTIGNQAFEGCTGLSSLSLPDSLQTIGWFAFEESGLTTIKLPSSLQTTGRNIVYDCQNLTSVDMSEVTPSASINTDTFLGANNIKEIYAGANFDTVLTVLKASTSTPARLPDNTMIVKERLTNTVNLHLQDQAKAVGTYLEPVAVKPVKGQLWGEIKADTGTDLHRLSYPTEITVTAGAKLEWRATKDFTDDVIELEGHSPLVGDYYGTYVWEDLGNIGNRTVIVNPAKSTVVYDGQAHSLAQTDIYHQDYPSIRIPQARDPQFRGGNPPSTFPDATAAGTYSVRITKSDESFFGLHNAFTITPYQITAEDITFTGENKTFDNTATSYLHAEFNPTSNLPFASDQLSIAITNNGYSDGPAIGTGKEIDYSWTLTSTTDSTGNYLLPAKPEVKGAIQQMTDAQFQELVQEYLSMHPEVVNKEYDGVAEGSVELNLFREPGEPKQEGDLIVEVTGAYSGIDAGADLTFTVTDWQVTSAWEGDQPALPSAAIKVEDVTISKKSVTDVAWIHSEREYDGSKQVEFKGESAAIVAADQSEDRLRISVVSETSSANIGTYQNVLINEPDIIIAGSAKDNYSFDATQFETVANATITPKELTVTGLQAVSRQRSEAQEVDLTGGTLVGVVAGETVAFARGIGTIPADKVDQVGEFPVTTTITLQGAAEVLGNYTLAQPTDLTVAITDLFTVTFDSNNGSPVAPITEVRAGDLLETPPAPTRENYRFDGWFTDAALTKFFDFKNERITDNTTLYAKWVTTAPVITTAADLGEVTVGESFRFELAHGNPNDEIVWSVQPGKQLPAGVTLTSAGVLSGTLTEVGEVTLPIRATTTKHDVRARNAQLGATDQAFTLKVVADKTDLAAVIGDAEDVIAGGGYTDASVKAVEDAVAAAKKVADDPSATPAEVAQAAQAVQEALEGLRADKTDLEALLEKEATAGRQSVGYTSASWRVYQNALAKAKAVAADEQATPAEVKAAVAALEAAVKGLTLASTSGGASSTTRPVSSSSTGTRATTSHSAIGKTGMVSGLGLSVVGVGTLVATLAAWQKRKR